MIDYHLHVVAHGDRPMTAENILEYCEVARDRGLQQMGITEHDRYLEDIDLSPLSRKPASMSRDVGLRLGIEIDFIPGNEQEMDRVATALPYDYVIGSVHRVDYEEVDHPDHMEIYEKWQTYELYEAYYENVRKGGALRALRGDRSPRPHQDLPPLPRPKDITPMLEETADAVAESGVVVDVNAAGLRKPIGEIYPARDFLEMFYRRGVPIILSSDAHAARRGRRRLRRRASKLVHDVGYREVATFKDHERGTLSL